MHTQLSTVSAFASFPQPLLSPCFLLSYSLSFRKWKLKETRYDTLKMWIRLEKSHGLVCQFTLSMPSVLILYHFPFVLSLPLSLYYNIFLSALFYPVRKPFKVTCMAVVLELYQGEQQCLPYSWLIHEQKDFQKTHSLPISHRYVLLLLMNNFRLSFSP